MTERTDYGYEGSPRWQGALRSLSERDVKGRTLNLLASLYGLGTDFCNDPDLYSGNLELEKALRIVYEEKGKVEQQKVSLTVIGTMKAGKSTTINAIVGMEIVPGRNTAMTVLPTVIVHDPRQNGVRLTLPRPEVMEGFVAELQEKLNDALERQEDDRERGVDKRKALYARERELLSRLDGASFDFRSPKTEPESVLEFLKDLNDIVRLGAKYGISPRFKASADLPLIEVKFSCIADLFEEDQPTFMLVDTPGVNEQGMGEHVKPIVQAELAKSSGVVFVMDYAQLNTSAHAELNEVLRKSIGGPIVDPRRYFFVVNKIDQQNSNSMNAEETCEYVRSLLYARGTEVEASSVFAVSSQQACLSARALRALKEEGALPPSDPQKTSWVDDFGKLAFGRYARSLLDNVAEVEAGARELLKESNFEAFVASAVRKSYLNAERLILPSALEKIDRTSGLLNDILSFRRDIFLSSAEDIQKRIRELNDTLAAVAKKADEFEQLCTEAEETAQAELDQTVTAIMKTARRQGEKSINPKAWSLEDPDLHFIQGMGEDIVMSESVWAIKNCLGEVKERIERILAESDGQAAEMLNARYEGLKKELQDRISPIKEALEARFQEKTPDFAFRGFPSLGAFAPDDSDVDLEETSTSSDYVRKVRAGAFRQQSAWLLSWLSEDLANQVRYTTEHYTRHEIRFEQIYRIMDALFLKFEERLKEHIRSSQKNVHAFFSEYLESTQRYLRDVARQYAEAGKNFEQEKVRREELLRKSVDYLDENKKIRFNAYLLKQGLLEDAAPHQR